MAAVEKYKLPRDKIDVEALSQTIAWYLNISGDDAEFLSYDPVRRDQITAQLQAQPGFEPSLWPCDIVVQEANGAIARLTPPKSLEE